MDSSRVTKPVVTDMNCVHPVHRSIGNMYFNESNTKVYILSPSVFLLIIVNDMYCVRPVHRSIGNTYLNESNNKLKPWFSVSLPVTSLSGKVVGCYECVVQVKYYSFFV